MVSLVHLPSLYKGRTTTNKLKSLFITHTMTYLHCFPILSQSLALLLFLVSLECAIALTENADSSDMAECGPRLLSLAPCAPFVQGSIPSPVQPCCDNLVDLYHVQPHCLCTLLNDTAAITSFPINKTLALNLPRLCNLSLNNSTCPGMAFIPPGSQISRGTNSSSSSTAISPSVAMAPRSNMGFGIGMSDGIRLKFEGGPFASAVTVLVFLLIEVLNSV